MESDWVQYFVVDFEVGKLMKKKLKIHLVKIEFEWYYGTPPTDLHNLR